jgi:hypothetical protein
MFEERTVVPKDTTAVLVAEVIIQLVEKLALEVGLNVAADDKELGELAEITENEEIVAEMDATLLVRTNIAPQILESMTAGPGADFK